jgi:V/A-type H+-transporting ATPase subunit K
METITLALGWAGIFAPVAFAAIGSIIGCARAGQAAAGTMLETEGGHGRYIGVSAMPSSQTIYGIVVMLTLNREVTIENAPALAGIGITVAPALMFSAIYQGYCCASAINVAKSKPEVFGPALAPAGIVESFAVFAFVFALLLAGDIPGS